MAVHAHAYVAQRRVLTPAPARRRVMRRRVRATATGIRVATFAAAALALILMYVWLTAQLTAETYRLHDTQAQQTQLLLQDNELRQRVSRLESLPRLEAAAASLHMTVPSSVALIAPPHAAAPRTPATAFAASIAYVERWLNVR